MSITKFFFMVNFWQQSAKKLLGLSPMDGVTDAPFRAICAQYGQPDLLFTEFINVEGLSHGATKGLPAFLYSDLEKPIIAQLYGVTPEAFYQACFIPMELGFDGIDINMGCPSKSVSNLGAGAGLIRTPKRAQEIIKACQQAVLDWQNGRKITDTKLDQAIIDWTLAEQKKLSTARQIAIQAHQQIPISVKTRTGYDQPITLNWLAYLIEMQPANISLHGRTLKQMYTGAADWSEIGKAAELVKKNGISFLGNGDISSFADAQDKIATYRLDGVLIGRAALGNPWLFQNSTASPADRISIALEHLQLHQTTFPTLFAPVKKHLGWYISGFNGAKELRVKLMLSNTFPEAETHLTAAQATIANPALSAANQQSFADMA